MMKIVKYRSLTVIFVVITLWMQCMMVGYAVPVESTVTNDTVSPCYEFTTIANAGLSISSGKATLSGTVIGYYGMADKVDMTLYLQRLENGAWKTTHIFSDIFDSNVGMMEQTVSVDEGYTYCVRGSYYVYDGSECEHITAYSATVDY